VVRGASAGPYELAELCEETSMRISSRVFPGALALSLALVVVFSVSLSRAPSARAYGRLAQWQIGLSFNCNNVAICGANGLGGFWGWAEFDSDNSADAELVGCQHFQGGPAGGAQHMAIDGTSWTIDPTTGDFVVTSEIDTITGHTGGPPITVTIASEYFDTGILARAGHYSSQTLFGMQAPPGTNFEIQVAQLHT
jgi:hypothetical protein